MKIEDTLLEVYPEAKDFVASLRDYGDLDRARIADKLAVLGHFLAKLICINLSLVREFGALDITAGN